MVETQVYEITLACIKAELIIMEECQRQPRSKGVVRKSCVRRKITGAINVG